MTEDTNTKTRHKSALNWTECSHVDPEREYVVCVVSLSL